MPYISANNSPTNRRPNLSSPKSPNSPDSGAMSPSLKRVYEKRELDMENAKKKRKTTPELEL